MHSGYNTHLREMQRISRQRAWRQVQIVGLAMLASTAFLVVYLALTTTH